MTAMLQKWRHAKATPEERELLTLYTTLPRVHELKGKIVDMCPIILYRVHGCLQSLKC